jgi:hypothetical protein
VEVPRARAFVASSEVPLDRRVGIMEQEFLYISENLLEEVSL